MSSNQNNVYVLGVGMCKFLKPRLTRFYTEMAFEAGVKAMLDAGVTYDDVQAGIGCFCVGDTCRAQRCFYQFGMTGIPMYNTNNACATGSTGLNMARNFVKGGIHDCVLVIGFEQMQPGPLGGNVTGAPKMPNSGDLRIKMLSETHGLKQAPPNPQQFGNAGVEYMEKYGATARDFAEIARVSHEHSSRNPYAQFQDVYTLEQIEQSPMIYYPITKLQCSPTSDGAGAAVIVSQKFLDARPELKAHAVLMAGQSLATDTPEHYNRSAMSLVGYDMTGRAAKAALNEAKVSIDDVKVVELHDCFSTNELITLEGLGLCEKGKAHHLVRNGDITYGGRVVVNPSGGLISKGHPLGATGLAQCAELTWQLRGWANNGRLVKDIDVALQHNLGLGGCVVITVYKRADGKKNTDIPIDEATIAKRSGLGYNPATAARYITRAQAETVMSKKAPCAFATDNTIDLIEARL
ncbi:sterol carrier protein 2 [Eremomyces bilateralis CBS 781.70]|uniref:propanoyl-CoA C-acyltransferase n=1 Tax=Eremomyces bilateralis CBS 781.70 TaxID=1392243 RepID=A0A6G1FRW2_9PEZI|nr:sterol carrier protein 2 [Eremomyces bilateralis CBS 781.70]KAF1808450.1 sterol carrier protein 2 [Eremomyces bilateralis CBS 781.70]